MAPGRGELWTASHRRGLAVILAIVIGVLGIRLAFNRMIVSDPQQPRGAAADQLADRIDPNVASTAELAEIPGLGEKKGGGDCGVSGGVCQAASGDEGVSGAGGCGTRERDRGGDGGEYGAVSDV